MLVLRVMLPVALRQTRLARYEGDGVSFFVCPWRLQTLLSLNLVREVLYTQPRILPRPGMT